MPFTSSLYVRILTRTSSSESGGSGCPCLVPGLERNYFQFLPIQYDVVGGYFVNSLGDPDVHSLFSRSG